MKLLLDFAIIFEYFISGIVKVFAELVYKITASGMLFLKQFVMNELSYFAFDQILI